jgi:hypothetical protein
VDRAVECYISNLNYIHRNSPNQKNFYHIRRICSLMRDITLRKVYFLRTGSNHFKPVLTIVMILCDFLPVDMSLHLCVLSNKLFVKSTPPESPWLHRLWSKRIEKLDHYFWVRIKCCYWVANVLEGLPRNKVLCSNPSTN